MDTQEPQLEMDCRACGQLVSFPYRHLGRRAACPTCGQVATLAVLDEDRLPDSEDYLTYRQFEFLLAYTPHRALLAPLLEGWFGCEVMDGFGGHIQLVRRDGQALELAAVHDEIQQDPDRRMRLERLARTLWKA